MRTILDKILSVITWPWNKIRDYREEKQFQKKLEELKKRDPFIYK